MDAGSQACCLEQLQRLAKAARTSPRQVAEAALDLARTGADGLRSNITHYIVDEGREALEARLGVKRGPFFRFRRWITRRPEMFFLALFPVLVIPIWVAVAVSLESRTTFALWASLAALAIVVTQHAQIIVGVTYKALALPRYILRIGARELDSETFRSAVVVPTITTSHDALRHALAVLEKNFEVNKLGSVLFGLLVDFGDAPRRKVESDTEFRSILKEGIRRLNREHGTRFFALLRPRRWNPSEGCWMGWERKRGKIVEFVRILTGEGGEAFELMGLSLTSLRQVKYVVTLDDDSHLSDGSVARLVGAMAHPLNTPCFEADSAKIVRGYTIIQPSIRHAAPGPSTTWFGFLIAPNINVRSPKHLESVRRFRVHNAGETYLGKGVFHVDGFARSLEGVFPENLILSHDRIEGLCGRVGRLWDAVVSESAPPTVSAYLQRFDRWLRGDLQALSFALSAEGRAALRPGWPCRLWTVLFPALEPLLYPALFLVLLSAILGWIPASMGILMVLLGMSSLSFFVPALGRSLMKAVAVSEIGCTRAAGLAARHMLCFAGRDLLLFAMLPFLAAQTVRSMLVAMYRLWISKRRLLQWTASNVFLARSGTRASWGGVGVRAVVSGLLAAGFWGLAGFTGMSMFAMGLLALWGASPVILQVAHRPMNGVLRHDRARMAA